MTCWASRTMCQNDTVLFLGHSEKCKKVQSHVDESLDLPFHIARLHFWTNQTLLLNDHNCRTTTQLFFLLLQPYAAQTYVSCSLMTSKMTLTYIESLSLSLITLCRSNNFDLHRVIKLCHLAGHLYITLQQNSSDNLPSNPSDKSPLFIN